MLLWCPFFPCLRCSCYHDCRRPGRCPSLVFPACCYLPPPRLSFRIGANRTIWLDFNAGALHLKVPGSASFQLLPLFVARLVIPPLSLVGHLPCAPTELSLDSIPTPLHLHGLGHMLALCCVRTLFHPLRLMLHRAPHTLVWALEPSWAACPLFALPALCCHSITRVHLVKFHIPQPYYRDRSPQPPLNLRVRTGVSPPAILQHLRRLQT